MRKNRAHCASDEVRLNLIFSSCKDANVNASEEDVARVTVATEEAKAKLLRAELAVKENSSSIIQSPAAHPWYCWY
jgi:hypothetical protein